MKVRKLFDEGEVNGNGAGAPVSEGASAAGAGGGVGSGVGGGASLDAKSVVDLATRAGRADEYQKQLEETRREMERLKEFRSKVERVAHPETAEDARMQHMVDMYEELGYSREQIAQMLAAPEDQTPERGGELEEVKKTQQTMIDRMRQDDLRRLEGLSQSITTEAIGQVPVLKDLVKNLEQRFGAGSEQVSRSRSVIEGAAVRRTRQKMVEKHRREGRWDDSWIGDLAKEAAREVAEEHVSAIGGDVSLLAGQRDSFDADEIVQGWAKRDVKPPSQEAVGLGEKLAQAKRYTESEISRMILGEGASDPASV